ncbi:unnamed protein product [Cunninghamella blakesleeana]
MTSEITTDKKMITKKSNVGRHRLYSNEQRKVRNREAQAAFRQRRSAYTRTLEDTVEKLEALIETLQQSTKEANERAESAEKRCTHLENEYKNIRNMMTYYFPQGPFNQVINSPSPSHESVISQPAEISSPSSTFSNDMQMVNNVLNTDLHQNINISSLGNSLPNNILGEYFILKSP